MSTCDKQLLQWNYDHYDAGYTKMAFVPIGKLTLALIFFWRLNSMKCRHSMAAIYYVPYLKGDVEDNALYTSKSCSG
jgi:hypothetical protein